ncbi:hypothetical protein HU720_11785 [Pseudomonas sp. SWRI51]|uniref:helix-turn-helix domain-containing transcriptional regulator n=1 Tax=Pseudomonas sp. SWRI51 TaxID=2745491 RepID=UPI001645B6F1|nr:hypothetical protein [Pseudomonas sp. SWRI51]MBC3411983.1 hypothetical protein [Pseudomonas sp. SWRI51]
MTETFFEFDAADYLTNMEASAQFLIDALETGDAAYILKAEEAVARAKCLNKCPTGRQLSPIT